MKVEQLQILVSDNARGSNTLFPPLSRRTGCTLEYANLLPVIEHSCAEHMWTPSENGRCYGKNHRASESASTREKRALPSRPLSWYAQRIIAEQRVTDRQ